MCIICVELLKQRMSISEAERAVTELLLTTKEETKEKKAHYIRLRTAIKSLDRKMLDKVMDEKLI